MLFTAVFMVVLIVLLVGVSRTSTYSKKIVREWHDEAAYRPSQQLLDIVSKMSSAEKLTLFPTLSMSASTPSVTPDLIPADGSTKVRISA